MRTSRIQRYADRVSGATAVIRMSKLAESACKAAEGYGGGKTRYGSGFQAGETESHILKAKYADSDRDIRNFGDFLIDYGYHLFGTSR